MFYIFILLSMVLWTGTLAEEGYFVPDSTTIACGPSFDCALAFVPGLEFGGQAVCWGDNYEVLEGLPDEKTFVQISVSNFYACGITIQEKALCWGSHLKIKDPPGLYLQISSGRAHTCGLLKDGSLFCWGENQHGQASPPSSTEEGRKRRIFHQLSCGGDVCCALEEGEGTVVCWGRFAASAPSFLQHRFGQVSVSNSLFCGIELGTEELICYTRQNRRVSYFPSSWLPLQISVGSDFVCMLRKEDNGISCRGGSVRLDTPLLSLLRREYGDNLPTKLVSPSMEVVEEEGGGVVLVGREEEEEISWDEFDQISSGFHSICAITMESKLVCWGLNGEKRREHDPDKEESENEGHRYFFPNGHKVIPKQLVVA